MHKSRKNRLAKARSEVRNSDATVSERYWGKTPVMGMVDREARKVRAAVVPNVCRETLQNKILSEIERGSKSQRAISQIEFIRSLLNIHTCYGFRGDPSKLKGVMLTAYFEETELSSAEKVC